MDNTLKKFLKSNPKSEIIVVQGLGFVGSVMSLVCANAINGDYLVIGVELPTKRGNKIIKDLNSGIFPLVAEDPKINELFDKTKKKGNFLATSNTDAYSLADVIVVDVNLDVKKANTPTGELYDYEINLDGFKKAIKIIGDNCKHDALILVETTVPPGTCEKVVVPIIHKSLKKRKLTIKNIKIGHSYERVMPGPGYIDSIQNFFRVYSGVDNQSAEATKLFLHSIIRTDEYPLTKLKNTNATEIAKVLENSYRAMNISFMVEWSRFAEESGIDIYEVIKAIRYRPTHSNLMFPGIGVGGYCLTKDALLASWSRQNLIGGGLPLKQSETAININDQMPRFAFELLKKHYLNLNNTKILILGVSYRGDVGDTRSSPVELFYNLLSESGAIISCHDPYVQYWEEKQININQDLDFVSKSNYDIIIIATGHKLYSDKKTIDMLLKFKSSMIYDTIGMLSESQIEQLKKKHKVLILGRGDY